MEEIKTNEQKEIKIEEVEKKVKEILNISEVEDLIKSNEKIVDYKDVTYRVKKPNFRQKQETYSKRVERFTYLLKDDKYMLESDLISNYKKRGIDIDDISKKINDLQIKRNDLMFNLGEAIKKGSSDSDLNKYKEEIESLNNEIRILTFQKTSYLEFSIENQVMIYMYSYLTFILTEKKDGENWVRLWNTWEEFQSSSEDLINLLSYYITMLTTLE